MSMLTRAIPMLLLTLAGPPCLAQEVTDLARQARGILDKHCHVCHGKDGASEAGFGYALNRNRLVEGKKVVPGKPDDSKIFKRLVSKTDPMPPSLDLDGKPITARPSEAEVKLFRDWIAAGAPDFDSPAPPRPFITSASVFEAIANDLATAKTPADRENRRYFSIVPLYNAGLSADELVTTRHGLAKLINSLSWGQAIHLPEPIDPDKLIFRIDLRWYGWAHKTWERVAAVNPYEKQLPKGAETVRVARLLKTQNPVARADWFVAAASRPDLYYDILDLPKTVAELEVALLGVSAAQNIATNKVARAGFNGSGVSGNNRMIERHEIPKGRTWQEKNAVWTDGGAFWKSYDFAGNTDRKNLFDFPLGPGTGEKRFQHDGGEIIFSLPNGLQAYMLVKDETRIQEGPIEIVSDRRKNAISVKVLNGISCMACHSAGMIAKDDQIRDSIARSGLKGYQREEIVAVYTLYPRKADFQKLLKTDTDRFLVALKLTGAHASKTEPISSLVGLFDREVDAKLAASEVGLVPEKFRDALDKSNGEIRRLFGTLLTGGTVKRDVMTRHFGDLRKAVGSGE